MKNSNGNFSDVRFNLVTEFVLVLNFYNGISVVFPRNRCQHYVFSPTKLQNALPPLINQAI